MRNKTKLLGLIIIFFLLSLFIGCLATQGVEQVSLNQAEGSEGSKIHIEEPDIGSPGEAVLLDTDNENDAQHSLLPEEEEPYSNINLPTASLKNETKDLLQSNNEVVTLTKQKQVDTKDFPSLKDKSNIGDTNLPVNIDKPLPENNNSEIEFLKESANEKKLSLNDRANNSETEIRPDSYNNIPIDEKSSLTTEAEIARQIMIPSVYLWGIVIVLIIVLIVFIKKQQDLLSKLKYEQNRIKILGVDDIESAQKMHEQLKTRIDAIESRLIILNGEIISRKERKGDLEASCSKLEKRFENQKLKLSRTKELYRAIENAVKRFHETDIPATYYRPLSDEELRDLETIAPTIMLNLNYMSYQDLRKEFRANQKQIDILLEDYANRYTTKANQSIYKLMVISLRSELQNILYNLKYEKLDNALFQVQALLAKYLVIATEGNQQIAGTMRKFIGELEHLFNNSVKIEYEYYVKKEQAKQEQLALRQQMREEAEERRQLAKQREQIAFEESKYQAEIEKVQELLKLEPEDSSKRLDIIAKLEELNIQLAQVEEKKIEITNLQKGKAGNVYIISNLGSFGDQVFKIGMTRRLDPQERVNELSSASVPFKYDVHSFIFSEDAVGLENELHRRLHARRLNKVNLRKEFFDISLEKLEQLVEEINPTAEFNRTMLAEDYNQSLSISDQELPLSDVYETKQSYSYDEEDDDNYNANENE